MPGADLAWPRRPLGEALRPERRPRNNHFDLGIDPATTLDVVVARRRLGAGVLFAQVTFCKCL